MKYLVVEIQKSSQGALATLVTAYDDLRHAESAYYALLSTCALSELPKHGAMLIGENSDCLKSEMYKN